MAKGKRVNGIYSEKLKAIRPFVSFDYDLRKPLHPASRKKIDRYFDAINEAQAGGTRPYRGKSKKRVRAVQRAADNQFENLPQVNVAFVPHNEANPRDVRFTRDGRVKFVGRNFTVEEILIAPEDVISDPIQATRDAIDESGTSAKWFQVLTARGYRTKETADRNLIGNFVAELLERYSPDPTNPGRLNNGKTDSQRFDKWFRGVFALNVRNQRELSQFLKADTARRENRARKQAALRERERNAKSKTKNRRR